MRNASITLAVARGITVCCMPAIHTVMLCSRLSVQQHAWVHPLRFIAEGPGAQLFMLIMGIFLATGTPKALFQRLRRSGLLWLSGYVLNVFRIYLPATMGWLPQTFLQDYGATAGPAGAVPLLLTGDILQFAGLAYGILSLLDTIKPVLGISTGVLLYLAFAFGGHYCWQLRSPEPLTDHLLALIGATDRRAFFPLFPWLCYPLAGWLLAKLGWIHREYWQISRLLLTGLVLGVAGLLAGLLLDEPAGVDFYRSGPGRTIAQTGFVLYWLIGLYYLVAFLPPGYLLLRWLQYCSRHITIIYWVHWIILGTSLGWLGYHTLDDLSSLAALTTISSFSFLITWLIHLFQTARNQ